VALPTLGGGPKKSAFDDDSDESVAVPAKAKPAALPRPGATQPKKMAFDEDSDDSDAPPAKKPANAPLPSLGGAKKPAAKPATAKKAVMFSSDDDDDDEDFKPPTRPGPALSRPAAAAKPAKMPAMFDEDSDESTTVAPPAKKAPVRRPPSITERPADRRKSLAAAVMDEDSDESVAFATKPASKRGALPTLPGAGKPKPAPVQRPPSVVQTQPLRPASIAQPAPVQRPPSVAQRAPSRLAPPMSAASPSDDMGAPIARGDQPSLADSASSRKPSAVIEGHRNASVAELAASLGLENIIG
jgi:hypothetical protein